MSSQCKQNQAVPVTRKRIYIAGPMTGLDNYNREAFIEAARQIATKTNLIPVHTAWVRDGLDWEEYMELAQDMLSLCDLVCVLPGHMESKGAQIEVKLARDAGMPVIELDKVVEEFGR